MKSIKPGRGPSRRGVAGSVMQIIWGVIWTTLVCVIMVPAAGVIGLLFALFGLCFIGMGVYSLLYHKRNAEADVHERDSLLEIVDCEEGFDRDDEDPAAPPAEGEAAAYCPWCGEKIKSGFLYCPRCGKKLP